MTRVTAGCGLQGLGLDVEALAADVGHQGLELGAGLGVVDGGPGPRASWSRAIIQAPEPTDRPCGDADVVALAALALGDAVAAGVCWATCPC